MNGADIQKNYEVGPLRIFRYLGIDVLIIKASRGSFGLTSRGYSKAHFTSYLYPKGDNSIDFVTIRKLSTPIYY